MPQPHVTGLPARIPPPAPSRPGKPLAERAESIEVERRHANLTSALGALLCVAAGACLVAGLPLVLAASLFVAGSACDLADGFLARMAADQEPTRKGAFIDSLCDKVGEAGVFLGLAAYLHDEMALMALLLAGFAIAWLTSFVKAFAEAQQLDIDWDDARIFGRAGRAVLLSATLLLAALFVEDQHTVLAVGLGVLLAFNCVTFAWRLTSVARCESERETAH